MLADGRNFLQQQWWIAAFPGLAIMVTTLAINLLGDGIRDIHDPRMQRALRRQHLANVVRCALIQAGHDLPMTAPIADIRDAALATSTRS